MKKQKTELVDIFNGKYLYIWRDEDTIFFSTPFATLNLSEEEWETLKRDLVGLGEL